MIRTRRSRARAPLIWIHGWLGDGGGDRTLRGLGRDVVSLTLPGYAAGGASGEMGVEAAIKAVGEAVKQQPDAVLVGHSMGGLIAVRGGLESHPRPRGLVLLAPVPPSGVYLEARARDLFAGATGDAVLLGKVVDYLTAKRLPSRWVESVVKDARRRASPEVLAAYLEGWVRPTPECGFMQPWDVPALLLLGRYDRAITSELATREILPWTPRARCVLLDECGHFPLAEVPLRTLRLIDDFLGSLDET